MRANSILRDQIPRDMTWLSRVVAHTSHHTKKFDGAFETMSTVCTLLYVVEHLQCSHIPCFVQIRLV